MKAVLLFRQRIDYEDGAIVEMVLWRVPLPVPPSAHSLKYSLFYGRPGVREVGYDNELEKATIGTFAELKAGTCSVRLSSWSPILGRMCGY